MGLTETLIVFWIGCPLFAAIVAHSKSRSAITWAALGVIFGPIALLGAIGVTEFAMKACVSCGRKLYPDAGWWGYCKAPQQANKPVAA